MRIKFLPGLSLVLGALVLPMAASGSQIVTKVAAGDYYSLLLKSDGSLWGMGDNYEGELGNGTNYTDYPYGSNQTVQIVTSGVTATTAGGYHNLFLKSNGSLWSTGWNLYGQLGTGTFDDTNRPVQIVAGGVTAVAAGWIHSLFLKSDGSLWGMGDNSHGELGDGSNNITNTPGQIVASGVTAVAGGNGHSLFLKSNGSLWAMGFNGSGQLGDGTLNQTNRPEQIVTTNVTAVAAGYYHSLFLKTDGSLWGMGYNTYGQLGDGSNNSTNRPQQIVASNVTAIAAGAFHSLFLKTDGSLWVMGYNDSGQLGTGVYNTLSPYGTNRPVQIVASGVTAIDGGYQHGLFVKSDGSLWAMGYNEYGQLGDDTYNNTNRPEQIAGLALITSLKLTKTNLTLNAVFGVSGSTNYLLASTNAALPRNQWTRVQTNILGTTGGFTFTNTVIPGVLKNFYLLQTQ